MKTLSIRVFSSFLLVQPEPETILLLDKNRSLVKERAILMMDHVFKNRRIAMVESFSSLADSEHHPARRTQYQIGQQQQMSSTLAGTVLGTKAAAWVDSDAVTPVYRRSRGFAVGTAIVRTGAGDYTLTLSDALDTAAGGDVCITAGMNHNAFASLAIELASTTTLRTRTCTTTAVPAVAAADLDYWIKVEEFGPN